MLHRASIFTLPTARSSKRPASRRSFARKEAQALPTKSLKRKQYSSSYAYCYYWSIKYVAIPIALNQPYIYIHNNHNNTNYTVIIKVTTTITDNHSASFKTYFDLRATAQRLQDPLVRCRGAQQAQHQPPGAAAQHEALRHETLSRRAPGPAPPRSPDGNGTGIWCMGILLCCTHLFHLRSYMHIIYHILAFMLKWILHTYKMKYILWLNIHYVIIYIYMRLHMP